MNPLSTSERALLGTPFACLGCLGGMVVTYRPGSQSYWVVCRNCGWEMELLHRDAA